MKKGLLLAALATVLGVGIAHATEHDTDPIVMAGDALSEGLCSDTNKVQTMNVLATEAERLSAAGQDNTQLEALISRINTQVSGDKSLKISSTDLRSAGVSEATIRTLLSADNHN